MDRGNPLDTLNDHELIQRFRLPGCMIHGLCNELADDLTRFTRRNRALAVHQQVLCALRFYATGGFQTLVGDAVGLHKSSVSRSVNAVSRCIARRRNEFIWFPNADADITLLKQNFYGLANFPNVLGAVDGTLIPIIAPHEDEV